jgi:transposase
LMVQAFAADAPLPAGHYAGVVIALLRFNAGQRCWPAARPR